MWGNRAGGTVAEAVTENVEDRHQASDDELDLAVETLSAVLRGFGRYSFDIDDVDAQTTNALAECWARHLVYGAPRPAGMAERSAGSRDWFGVRHFVTEHRQSEYAYVAKATGGMRQAIWTFIHQLQRSITDDSETEHRLAEQLDRIRSASRRATMEEMRSEIAAAVGAIGRALEERKLSQHRQIEVLHEQIRGLGSQLEEARQESSLDSLTGLYNRRSFDQVLSRTSAMSSVFEQKACLLLVDADHFKSINDTHGHDAGDRVLRLLADCLTRAVPRKGDFIARYGGEEFALILPDSALSDGRRMAERILDSVRDLSVPMEGSNLSITVSVGLASAESGESADAWLKRADQALYRSKRLGRDRYEVV